MPPRRRNQPRGPAAQPNQNAAFDQQLVIGMIEDLRRQVEALAQRNAQGGNPSQDGNGSEGDDYQHEEEFENPFHVNVPRIPAPIAFDHRCWDGGFRWRYQNLEEILMEKI